MLDPQQLPAIANWHAMDIGLIAFPQDPQSAVEQAQSWWPDLIGADVTSTRKRLTHTDQGSYEGRLIALEVDPLRVVWKATGVVDGETASNLEGPPSVGAFPSAVEWFDGIMTRWLESMCPSITRLAFTGQLFLKSSSREAAYRILNEYLPKVSVDPDSSEFQYRINRKRKSLAIPELTVNRLVTWSAVKIDIQIQVSSPSTTERPLLRNTFEGCVLQLDINTDPDNKTIFRTVNLVPLWRELTKLGAEVAERGDVR